MNAVDIMGFVVLLVGVFFAGRMLGISRGIEIRNDRVERQRADEIRKLLEFVSMVWRS